MLPVGTYILHGVIAGRVTARRWTRELHGGMENPQAKKNTGQIEFLRIYIRHDVIRQTSPHSHLNTLGCTVVYLSAVHKKKLCLYVKCCGK